MVPHQAWQVITCGALRDHVSAAAGLVDVPVTTTRPRKLGKDMFNSKRAPVGAPRVHHVGKAQLFLTSKVLLATCLPSSEMSTLYLPSGHRFGFCTRKVVVAGPSAVIDWLVLVTSWPLPSR
jgi:hypothetical protein